MRWPQRCGPVHHYPRMVVGVPSHGRRKTVLSEGQFQLLSRDVYPLILSFLESQGDFVGGNGGRWDTQKKKKS
jgi:hypothetical protein